jgi:hypothetical protein
LTSTIIPTIYLGSWALVASIITTRFMVDQHPFFFEALSRINNTILSNNTSRWHVIFYHPQHVHVFFHLNNSSDNKWFNLKIPFWSIYTIIPFSACFLTKHLKPIVVTLTLGLWLSVKCKGPWCWECV